MANLDVYSLEVVKGLLMKDSEDDAAHYNTEAQKAYQQAAMDWVVNASHQRDLGLPIPQKPLLPQLMHSISDENGFPKIVMGPEFVANPVDDLPEKPVVPAGNVHIGGNVGGNFFRAYPDDTAPDGYVAEIAEDGKEAPKGKYRKLKGPFGTGVYEKVA